MVITCQSFDDGIINQTIIMSVEQQEITIPGRSPPCSRNRWITPSGSKSFNCFCKLALVEPYHRPRWSETDNKTYKIRWMCSAWIKRVWIMTNCYLPWFWNHWFSSKCLARPQSTCFLCIRQSKTGVKRISVKRIWKKVSRMTNLWWGMMPYLSDFS